MIKLQGSEDYYPTPEKLFHEITKKVDWGQIENVLEPSAGTGHIVEYLLKAKEDWRYGGLYRRGEIDIDCIEIEPEFRAILKDKGFRIVHDDF